MAKRSSDTAYDRVKARIRERLDSERDKPRNLRKMPVILADRLGISKGTLSRMLNAKTKAPEQGLLHHLDAIAAYLDTSPAELVRQRDDPLMELTSIEQRIIAHVRQFPPFVREQIVMFYDYFGGLLPEERHERRWWTMIRRLDARDQQQVEDSIRLLLRKKRTHGPRTAAAAAPLTTARGSDVVVPPQRSGKRARG